MKSLIAKWALVLVIFATPSLSFAQDKIQKVYTDDELVSIFEDAGYRAVEILEERVIQLKIDGHNYALYVYDDNDLQLYFGLTGFTVDADDINEWNRTKRLCRAYIDLENDPVIESDLLANAGLTPKQITEWVAVFDDIARGFRRFLNRKDEE